jgi:hypothetical protein
MTAAELIYPDYAYLRTLGYTPTRALHYVRNGTGRKLWLRFPCPHNRFGIGPQAMRLQAAYDHYNHLTIAMRNHGLHRPARLRWWACYLQARNPWPASR